MLSWFCRGIWFQIYRMKRKIYNAPIAEYFKVDHLSLLTSLSSELDGELEGLDVQGEW